MDENWTTQDPRLRGMPDLPLESDGVIGDLDLDRLGASA
jgi:hypothetical protein